MGSGYHGGFGNTYGSRKNKVQEEIRLPDNVAQLKHIFSDRPGHLPDTPENRKLLYELAHDAGKYIGTDKYGNSWHAEITEEGSQNWVRHKNGVINEGGRNPTPKVWDCETGFNKNPVLRRKKRK